ncbi:hypothetical protein ONZ45_g9263 [Pleurotus djamor]|nr:hypothetical protein ONZ45_g9263 [Pleurotus djamor]
MHFPFSLTSLTSQIPFWSSSRTLTRPTFNFTLGQDIFLPIDLVRIRIPGVASVNLAGDLFTLPVKTYNASKAEYQHSVLLSSPTHKNLEASFPVGEQDHVFWIDSRTVAHLTYVEIDASPYSRLDLHIREVLYDHAPPALSLRAPKLAGVLLAPGPSEFQYIPEAKRLVFYDVVLPDGSFKFEEDEAVYLGQVMPTNFENMFHQNSEQSVTPALLSVELSKEDGRNWVLGTEYSRLTTHERFPATGYELFREQMFVTSEANVLYKTVSDFSADDCSSCGFAQDIFLSRFDGNKAAWLEYADGRVNIVVYDIDFDVEFTISRQLDLFPTSISFSATEEVLYVTGGDDVSISLYSFDLPTTPLSTSNVGFSADVPPQLITTMPSLGGIHSLRDGAILATYSSYSHPNEVIVIRSNQSENHIEQITHVNDHILASKDLSEGELFDIPGSQDEHGWVIKPKGWTEGSDLKYPAILIHFSGYNGQSQPGAWSNQWTKLSNPNDKVFAAQGFFVIVIGDRPQTDLFTRTTMSCRDFPAEPPTMLTKIQKGWTHIISTYPQIDPDRAVFIDEDPTQIILDMIKERGPQHGLRFKAEYGIFSERGMWERTLQDLIRGLRANKKDESKFIAKAVDEIRTEIKGDDMELKAGAVLKLTYLDMLGYDMSWASFHVVEVMSSPKYHLKTVGYLAATQSFNQDTDVLMLTTNLLKKDLTSTPADVAVTLNGISHIITADLGRDLSKELLAMLTHSHAHIRKRAVLVLYKVVMAYPEITEQAVARLKEKLEDGDPGVVAATVNVICELSRRNPTDYLDLAPQLFHLMTTSPNNWMLIKIIKLFGSLCPHEPRLVKKLLPPITDLISTTPAISLLYECVHTCIIGGMLQGLSGSNLARLCVSKLAAFIQDPDQNLKYIALMALTKIVPSYPHLVAEYQETILASVNDQDISIRMRALDLVSAMVNPNNLQSMVQQILSHLARDITTSTPTATQSLTQLAAPTSSSGTKPDISPSQSPAYRLVLSERILTMCSQSLYENVTNFEWYLSVLVDLAHVANVGIGMAIRDQLVDIVGRVRSARRYAVKLMYTLLSDDAMVQNAQDTRSCSEVLWAAAWICGEYSSELAEPQKLLPFLLRPEMSNLPPDIIAVYIQSAMKLFGHWAAELAQRWSSVNDDLPEVKTVVATIIERLQEFVASPHIEVQERSLPPVSAAEADDQEPEHGSGVVKKVKKSKKGKEKDLGTTKVKGKKRAIESARSPDLVSTETPEELAAREKRRIERLEKLKDDPYYIIDDKPVQDSIPGDIDSIPIVKLEDMPPLSNDPAVLRAPILKDDSPSPDPPVVDREGEMPEGAILSPIPRPQSATPRPAASSSSSLAPAYQTTEDIDLPRTRTPEPIKVVRTKKKGTKKKAAAS